MDIVIDVINYIIKLLGVALNLLLSILPSSPFKAIDGSAFQTIIGYANWFIPVYDIEAELAACCAAIIVYYCYQIIMRWAKAIE